MHSTNCAVPSGAEDTDGLTKREWLIGMIASGAAAMTMRDSETSEPLWPPNKYFADYCIKCADAILEELNDGGDT